MVTHSGKKLARLMALGALGVVASLLCSCNGAGYAQIIPCEILTQAQVAIPNSLGITQTYNAGGVNVAGTWVSDNGLSNCSGTAHGFGGFTSYATGVYPATGVKMNANWQVAADWSSTNFSSCPTIVATQSEPIPDSGALFIVKCHL